MSEPTEPKIENTEEVKLDLTKSEWGIALGALGGWGEVEENHNIYNKIDLYLKSGRPTRKNSPALTKLEADSILTAFSVWNSEMIGDYESPDNFMKRDGNERIKMIKREVERNGEIVEKIKQQLK